jgi:hypothetical protein
MAGLPFGSYRDSPLMTPLTMSRLQRPMRLLLKSSWPREGKNFITSPIKSVGAGKSASVIYPARGFKCILRIMTRLEVKNAGKIVILLWKCWRVIHPLTHD